jgi:RNA polymerase sigma-70 factor (ECF subfamily)
LSSRLRSEAEADEVFSQFLERLWKGLPGFQHRCSVRTWCYTLARHAADTRYAANVAVNARHSSLTDGALQRAVEQVRTETQIYQRTQTKDRMRELRQRLSAEEQALIILRVDRGLDWRELAQVMLHEDEAPPSLELDRSAARLRKRFQAARDKLKQLAIEAGLLESKDSD